jgi:hypothetical protein
MLKYGEPNPLAVFGLRQVDHCPPHFARVEFELKGPEKVIQDWIWANLSGRFWFGDYYIKDSNNHVNFSKCAAFEIPGEASMFGLILDQINKHDFDLF